MKRRDFILLTAAALPAAPAFAAPHVDPVLPLYRRWLEARRLCLRLADLPGNGNYDAPESKEAEALESEAFSAMIDLTPNSMAGTAAIAHVLWDLDGPSVSPENPEYDERTNDPNNKQIRAIWRAASGQNGLPPRLD